MSDPGILKEHVRNGGACHGDGKPNRIILKPLSDTLKKCPDVLEGQTPFRLLTKKRWNSNRAGRSALAGPFNYGDSRRGALHLSINDGSYRLLPL